MEINTQIDVYLKARAPKEHENRMLDILKDYIPTNPVRIIDIGCARGTFLKMLAEQFPDANLTGIDYSKELIKHANRTLNSDKVDLIVSDALNYSPSELFDIGIVSGVLSIFDDFQGPLKKWLSWLNANGRLFVFGVFNSNNIDTIIKFRNNEVRVN